MLKGKLGFGTAPLGNMFRNIPEEEAMATVMPLGSMAFVTSISLHSMAPGWPRSALVKHYRNTVATTMC
jgi:hypothetical protein